MTFVETQNRALSTPRRLSAKVERRSLRGNLPASIPASIVVYDPINLTHAAGFVDLLQEQGKAHDHYVSTDVANTVGKNIGPDYQVNLICSKYAEASESIKGMAVTTEADFAEGHLLFLEDIVITENLRRKGLAAKLIDHTLLEAWENQYAGLAWETGRDNQNARMLYEKIDPSFDASRLHDVWCLSERQCAEAARMPVTMAHRASPMELNHTISRTLHEQPDKDIGFLSTILNRQELHGLNAQSFMVTSDNGVFAMTSVGYSTFEGSRRADTRLYLPDQFEDAEVIDVVKSVSAEMLRRKWRGSSHIEFANNTINLSQRKLQREKEKVEKAQAALKQSFNAGPLLHNEAPMVPYSLVGKRYVAAVLQAAINLPEPPLSNDGVKRLEKARLFYGLKRLAS